METNMGDILRKKAMANGWSAGRLTHQVLHPSILVCGDMADWVDPKASRPSVPRAIPAGVPKGESVALLSSTYCFLDPLSYHATQPRLGLLVPLVDPSALTLA